MAKRLVDKLVYKITKKPTHYKEVRNPPQTALEKLKRPQDARQVQYNKWSKATKVYSGSYLPKDDSKLLKQGWTNETSHKIDQLNPKTPKTYRRKSTDQWVRHDKNNDNDHWHWYNWWKKEKLPRDFMRKKTNDVYLDKYGNPCAEKSTQSHLEGQD